jgi:hypothetical protein
VGQNRASYLNNVITIKDVIQSPAAGTSPWEQFSELAIANDPGAGFDVYDDFVALQNQATNGLWLVTKGTGGSVALNSSAPVIGGWVSIPTAASSNDYQIFTTQQPVFNVFNGLDICFEAMIQCTEANTNKASWFVGLTSVKTTGFLQNTGVPPTSYSGAVIYKTTGAMAVNAQTSNSTTQNTTSTGCSTTTTTRRRSSRRTSARWRPTSARW